MLIPCPAAAYARWTTREREAQARKTQQPPQLPTPRSFPCAAGMAQQHTSSGSGSTERDPSRARHAAVHAPRAAPQSGGSRRRPAPSADGGARQPHTTAAARRMFNTIFFLPMTALTFFSSARKTATTILVVPLTVLSKTRASVASAYTATNAGARFVSSPAPTPACVPCSKFRRILLSGGAPFCARQVVLDAQCHQYAGGGAIFPMLAVLVPFPARPGRSATPLTSPAVLQLRGGLPGGHARVHGDQEAVRWCLRALLGVL